MPEGNKLGIVARDIDDRDVPSANLVFGRLRDRNLPVATAVFAERVIASLKTMATAEMLTPNASPDGLVCRSTLLPAALSSLY